MRDPHPLSMLFGWCNCFCEEEDCPEFMKDTAKKTMQLS